MSRALAAFERPFVCGRRRTFGLRRRFGLRLDGGGRSRRSGMVLRGQGRSPEGGRRGEGEEGSRAHAYFP